jgi:Protein of unknown function (DUF4232)
MIERVRNTAPIGLLVLATLVGGCASSKHQTATTQAARPAVPWTSERPPQLAERNGTAPPCRAAGLVIADKTVQFAPSGEGGIAVVAIHNNGDRACSLSGRPTARMVKKDGPRQVQISPAASPPTFPYVSYPASTLRQLRPGENAGLTISWANWCDPKILGKPHVPPSAIRITLPHGRGSLSADYNAVPGCFEPGAPSRIGAAVFQPSQVPLRTPWTHALVQAQIPGQPLHGRRGEILHFRVVLHNLSDFSVPFSTCPAYIQQLAPTGKTEAYRLNCAQAHPIKRGRRIAFAMQLRVPADAPTGGNGLFWLLDPFGAQAPEAIARVLIAG